MDVMPVQTGIQFRRSIWTPAFAGVTRWNAATPDWIARISWERPRSFVALQLNRDLWGNRSCVGLLYECSGHAGARREGNQWRGWPTQTCPRQKPEAVFLCFEKVT